MQYLYKLRVHVYWTKVSDVHITNELKWRQIPLCIVSVDPRLVIFAYLQVCDKSVIFFDSDSVVTLVKLQWNLQFSAVGAG